MISFDFPSLRVSIFGDHPIGFLVKWVKHFSVSSWSWLVHIGFMSNFIPKLKFRRSHYSEWKSPNKSPNKSPISSQNNSQWESPNTSPTNTSHIYIYIIYIYICIYMYIFTYRHIHIIYLPFFPSPFRTWRPQSRPWHVAWWPWRWKPPVARRHGHAGRPRIQHESK